MKHKTRKKKVVRRKRRSRKSMTEKRVMQIKRGLMKRAKKLRLGAKRTGAYVYGTLRRIVGNRGLTPSQQKMLDFLKRVYPQYSELARDSATKKDASRLARLKLIKVRSFKRTGTSRGKRFSMMIMEARAMAPKGGQLSSPVLGLARNPAHTDKAHFGYAKNGMELLGTGLKIKKGERVYMTPATNIPGGGFFVEPAYPTGLWKQGSGGSILIKPKDFDDEITYVEPRGEYRPTPQVKPDYKYGIYTGRGIARNSRRAFPTPRFVGKGEYVWKKLTPSQKLRFIMASPRGRQSTPRSQELFASRGWNFLPRSLKIDLEARFANVESDELMRNPMRSFASLHPSDRAKLNRFSDYVNSFYGKGGVYARDFKNGGFDRKTIERAIMVYIDDVRKGKVEWGDGDSIDRERVRMILEPSYSMSIPKGATILRPNRRMGLRGNPVEQRYTVDADRRKNYSLAEARRIAEERTRRFGMRGIYRSSSIFPYKKPVRANPPMCAHGMMSHRTHGLSLKQMMKLYRLVSSGNPKAVMFARRTLGIPMSESLSQVKAVVYHHVMDLRGKM
jgi:hypothetical protein